MPRYWTEIRRGGERCEWPARESAAAVSACVMGGPSEFHTKAGGRVITHLPRTDAANRAAYSAGVRALT